MKLYLDTSNPTTILKLDDEEYEWDSGRTLARDLHKFIHDKLVENGADWHDISEITFFAGPGSFTGLRIGATVVNTLSSDLKVPLYNHRGEKVDIILPEYGRPANITPPKK
jgi:tRNA threonylcarbamoyladenosine biosynthesis protein TsaB